MSDRIYFSPPTIEDEDIQQVVGALKGGWIAPVGPELDQFEENLAKRFNFSNLLALNSGTSALHLAVKLAGVGEGDQVIIGSFGFVAAANAVLYEGGEPVFIDSDPETWNISHVLLDQYLSKQATKPKAVIMTYIYGLPGNAREIAECCTNHGVKLIEDAAEALGSASGGAYCGAFGDFSALSFNGNKIITTGGGGALVCRNPEDYEKAKFWATQSKESADHFHHTEVGYNYRLSNILAALGSSQLSRMVTIIQKKKAIFDFYTSQLKNLDWIQIPQHDTDQWNHWVVPILINRDFIHQITPSDLVLRMEESNIEIKRFWKPLHMQPFLSKYEMILNGTTEDFFRIGFCLPCGVGITKEELSRVIDVLKKVSVS